MSLIFFSCVENIHVTFQILRKGHVTVEFKGQEPLACDSLRLLVWCHRVEFGGLLGDRCMLAVTLTTRTNLRASESRFSSH